MSTEPLQWLAPVLGLGIAAAFFLALFAPALLAALMATGRVRYREWLAGLALLASAGVASLAGDFLYNLLHWTVSAPSRTEAALFTAVCFGSPLLVLALILARTRRRAAWALAFAVLAALVTVAIRDQYTARERRDAEALLRGQSGLAPESADSFVPCWRDPHGTGGRLLLRGHVREGVPLTLLGDPFGPHLEARRCTARAGAYLPPAPDPAVLGDATEVADPRGCELAVPYALAAVNRAVADYRPVPWEPAGERLDAAALLGPDGGAALAQAGLSPGELDLAGAEAWQATGPGGERLLVWAPRLTSPPPPEAFPCARRALLVSLGARPELKVALPSCALSWNLFALDGALYLAAVTQAPMPPAAEAMGPEQTRWLFRVEAGGLTRLWPDR